MRAWLVIFLVGCGAHSRTESPDLPEDDGPSLFDIPPPQDVEAAHPEAGRVTADALKDAEVDVDASPSIRDATSPDARGITCAASYVTVEADACLYIRNRTGCGATCGLTEGNASRPVVRVIAGDYMYLDVKTKSDAGVLGCWYEWDCSQ